MTAPLVATSDRPYQLLPPLSVEQRDLLRQSIKENGVLEPVVFDEDGEILDGHHRVEIAEELGIEYPRRVIEDLDRPGKHLYALTVNVARRQLDHAARSALVAQMRIRGLSIREIAKATGLPKTTVARDLAQVSHVGHLPEAVKGADGKTYAATRTAVTAHPSWPTEAELKPWESLAPAADRISESMEPVADDPRDRTHGAEFESYDAAEPETCLGADMDCGRPLPCPDHPRTPAEQIAAVAEAAPEFVRRVEPDLEQPDLQQVEAERMETQRVQIIDRARRRAPRLVHEIRSLVVEVMSGMNLGETGLITAQTIAELRELVDALEARLEATQ